MSWHKSWSSYYREDRREERGGQSLSLSCRQALRRATEERTLSMQARQITTLVISGFLGATLLFTGCAQKGPAQRAGEHRGRAIENRRDAVTPPGPAEKAGRSLDRAMDD